ASDKIDITKWVYDTATGLLTDKVYADGHGPSYTYTSEGKLSRRTWARGITTDYAYDFAGALTNVVYNDETPAVAYTYNRLGQQLSATTSVSTNIFVYSPTTLELDYELQNGAKIDRSTDDLGRNTGYALYNPVDPVNPVKEIVYGYNNLGQFISVLSACQGVAQQSLMVTNEFDYSYLPGSDILSGYTASTSSTGSTILTVSRFYELNRDLITAITNSVGLAPLVVSSFDYTNDTLGRRTARSDYYINRGSTEANTFGYNAFSEVINANMGTNTYSYAYDPIGNRDQCTIDNGQLTTTNVYAANGLNQYTNITGGIAAMPVHDLDGKLASFNGWQYVWNGENRLIQASNDTAVVTYTYDHQGRMVTKTINDVARRYLWDNFNIIQILAYSQNHTYTNSFVWGLDLSESLQEAGGVGGLLAEIQDGTPYFSAFDANGNVTEYVSTNGNISAHYEYSPFGELTLQSGDLAASFTHRFSTKPWCAVTGLSEYELRKYKPRMGRWLSRDPIEERGGVMLYGFVGNNAVGRWDLLGMSFWNCKDDCKKDDIAYLKIDVRPWPREGVRGNPATIEKGFAILDALASSSDSGVAAELLQMLGSNPGQILQSSFIVLIKQLAGKDVIPRDHLGSLNDLFVKMYGEASGFKVMVGLEYKKCDQEKKCWKRDCYQTWGMKEDKWHECRIETTNGMPPNDDQSNWLKTADDFARVSFKCMYEAMEALDEK
ncbi:MAG: RHS repeat-associated core domain-containing protein, partial [Kiritimatiellae bacterium]|nr:RHS repeat-associated core domain-containing protein [Kiritimatiellia bacterium]